jgi:putative spermidine/putrescine transport system substrate-binding protein
MKEKRFSRRQFNKLLGAGIVGASVGPFVLRYGRASSNKQLIVCSWGGVYQDALRKAYYKPFEKETGIRVIDTSSPKFAKVKAQVDSNNIEWDVIEGGDRWYWVFVNQGLVEPLDMNKINTADLVPAAVKSHGIGHVITSMCIGYNTDKFKDKHPTSWADFWNVKKFPGTRSYLADVTYSAEFALLADGVSPENLYPPDLDRAYRKLEELKPHIKVYWKNSDQAIQLVSQGEVVMAPCHNGRVTNAKLKGLPIDLTWDQGSYGSSYLYIVKGSPHREEAHQFINFCTQAKPQSDLAMEIPYGPTNKNALALVPSDRRKLLPTYPDNLKHMWPLNGKWLGENYDEINDRWQKFMLA